MVLIRDTSGFVSDADLEWVTSEVVGIATGMGIRGWALAHLGRRRYGSAHHPPTPHAAELARVHGLSGTALRVGITAALDLKLKQDCIVVFTDGKTTGPTKPAVPVVICLVGATAEAVTGRASGLAVTVLVDH
jgi:predicted metal-dependent peptidase